MNTDTVKNVVGHVLFVIGTTAIAYGTVTALKTFDAWVDSKSAS